MRHVTERRVPNGAPMRRGVRGTADWPLVGRAGTMEG